MTGPDARAQVDEWVAGNYGTHYDFDNLAFHSYLYSLPGVTFRSIQDPYGNPINYSVIVSNIPMNPNIAAREIVGIPWSQSSSDDGRVVYQMTFDTPQKWAGVVRHWDIYYTVTKFYDKDGNLLAQFGPYGTQKSGWDNYYIGYLAETDLVSHWVSRIVCDGVNPPGFTYNKGVGYTNDLYFGTCLPSPAPIPGTVWLLGAALMGLASCRKKFRP